MEKRPDFKMDAVAEVRRIRDAQHERVGKQSWDAKVAFYRDRAAELNRSLAEAGKLNTRRSTV